MADELLAVAEDKKAWEPVLVDLRGKTTIAEYFVICEADTDRQVRAIADAMLERLRAQGIRPLRVDGYLAHVFLPGERSYYDLESLWAAAAKGRRPKAI